MTTAVLNQVVRNRMDTEELSNTFDPIIDEYDRDSVDIMFCCALELYMGGEDSYEEEYYE